MPDFPDTFKTRTERKHPGGHENGNGDLAGMTSGGAYFDDDFERHLARFGIKHIGKKLRHDLNEAERERYVLWLETKEKDPSVQSVVGVGIWGSRNIKAMKEQWKEDDVRRGLLALTTASSPTRRPRGPRRNPSPTKTTTPSAAGSIALPFPMNDY
jgi:hypothetical protein